MRNNHPNTSQNTSQNAQPPTTNITLHEVFYPVEPVLIASPVLHSTTTDDADKACTKWDVVWAEAKLLPSAPTEPEEDYTTGTLSWEQHNPDNDNQISSGDPLLVPSMEEGRIVSGLSNSNNRVSGNVNNKENNNQCNNTKNNEAKKSDTLPSTIVLRNSNCISIIIGLPLTISAVASTFALEISATIIYLLAFGFYQVANMCKRCPILWIFYGTFMIVVGSLLLTDVILLFTSVLVIESIAFTVYLSTCLFGGCTAANLWRQYIRRICHLFRWAWRDFTTPDADDDVWKLPRIFAEFPSSKKKKSNDSNNAICTCNHSTNDGTNTSNTQDTIPGTSQGLERTTESNKTKGEIDNIQNDTSPPPPMNPDHINIG